MCGTKINRLTHRAENVDDDERLINIVNSLINLYNIVFQYTHIQENLLKN